MAISEKITHFDPYDAPRRKYGTGSPRSIREAKERRETHNKRMNDDPEYFDQQMGIQMGIMDSLIEGSLSMVRAGVIVSNNGPIGDISKVDSQKNAV